MRSVRVAVAAVAAVTLVPLTATAAFAAPPTNDRPDGAVALTLGQTFTEDTTQATTGRLDERLNEFCGAPFTNASVWFTFTPTDKVAFAVTMKQSDYTGGFMIFKGTPSLRHFRTCGPELLGLRAKVGTTYTIVAFSDTATQGGNLVLHLKKAPRPRLALTVDTTGQALPHGKAQISGTLTCSHTSFGFVHGTLIQIWKRVKISGFFQQRLHRGTCDAQTQTWESVVGSSNGLFASGKAVVRYSAVTCGLVVCTEVKGRQPIMIGDGKVSLSPAVTTSVSYDRKPQVWPSQ